MKQKICLFLAMLLCAIFCAGCGEMETGANASLSSVLSTSSSISQNVSSQAVLSSESSSEVSELSSAPQSMSAVEASSAPEYYCDNLLHDGETDEEKRVTKIVEGETLTLSDGRELGPGLLLPDGRYFSRKELNAHNYNADRCYILPDGTLIHGNNPIRLVYQEGTLTPEEWEEQEEKNFPEEERWRLANCKDIEWE